MKKVGIAILKNKLSYYVDQVKAGSALLVTDHGKPVAKLVPVNYEQSPNLEEQLSSLVAEQLVEYQAAKGVFGKTVAINLGQDLATKYLDQDREE